MAAKQEAAVHRSYEDSNKHLMEEWIQCLDGRGFEPAADIKDCLFHSEKLEADEKDVSRWILQSDELTMWMQDDESRILQVNLPTPPASLSNPLSFTSALFTKSVQSAQHLPILAYFCMHRNNESAQEWRSGAAVLVNSLIIQLIQFITYYRPTVDLSTLDSDAHHVRLRKAKEKPKHGLALLKRLLQMLPENETVFVVIDCISWLSGDIEKGKKLMSKLAQLFNDLENVVIRTLVTDTIPGCHLATIAHVELLVPRVVPGSGVVDARDHKKLIVESIDWEREKKLAPGQAEHTAEDSSEYEDQSGGEDF